MSRLPQLYRDCEHLLVPSRFPAIARARGGRPGSLSLNEPAVLARADMLTELSSWAGLVADERSVPAAARPRRAVADLVGFLLDHLPWLAGHSAIEDALTEVARLVVMAEEAIDPRPRRRFELGPCDQPACGGTVYACNSASTSVSCDRGHQFRPSDWLLLQRRLGTGRSTGDRVGVSSYDRERTA